MGQVLIDARWHSSVINILWCHLLGSIVISGSKVDKHYGLVACSRPWHHLLRLVDLNVWSVRGHVLINRWEFVDFWFTVLLCSEGASALSPLLLRLTEFFTFFITFLDGVILHYSWQTRSWLYFSFQRAVLVLLSTLHLLQIKVLNAYLFGLMLIQGKKVTFEKRKYLGQNCHHVLLSISTCQILSIYFLGKHRFDYCHFVYDDSPTAVSPSMLIWLLPFQLLSFSLLG